MNKNFFTSLLSAIRTHSMSFIAWAREHRMWASLLGILVIGCGYLLFTSLTGSASATAYEIGTVSEGSIAVTVSESGQIKSNQSLDLSPKTSGTVTYVGAKAGDTVKAGTVLVKVDDTDAQKTLRDAQASLTSAQITYRQAIADADTSTAKARATALSNASETLADLNTALQTLDDALHNLSDLPGHTVQVNADAYASIVGSANAYLATNAGNEYTNAKIAYNKAVTLSGKTSQDSSDKDILALSNAVYAAAQTATESTTDTYTLMTMVDERLQKSNTTEPVSFTSLLTSVASAQNTLNSDLASTLSARDTLTQAVATLSTKSTKSLEVQSAELSLAKAQNTYADARDALEDYVVRAPFDGTVASVDVQVNDKTSGTVATLITTGEYAEISLNEVDAADVKVGNPVSLTFDAIDGLTLDGTVSEVDPVGTVSSGVVSYSVKISLDTQDERVKPGMTVTAVITSTKKDNAIIIPSSALQTSGENYYVQVVKNELAVTNTGSATDAQTAAASFSNTETISAAAVTVEDVPVTIGLQNDTEVEITNGLSVGDRIVTGTVTTSSTSSTSSGSLFSLFGNKRTSTSSSTKSSSTTSSSSSTQKQNADMGGGPPGGF